MILKIVSKTFKFLDSAGTVGSMAPLELPSQISSSDPAESQEEHDKSQGTAISGIQVMC